MTALVRLFLLLAAAGTFALSWLHEQSPIAAWIGLAMMFVAIGQASARRAAAAGYLFGAVALAASFHWAPHMLTRTFDAEDGELLPQAVFAVLVLWEAIPFAFLGLQSARAARGLAPTWTPACAWVALESFWPRVFPWSFAHTQTGAPVVLQTAEIGGAALVSFIIVLACFDLAQRINRFDLSFRRERCGPACALGAALAFGAWRLHALRHESPSWHALRIGVVQVEPSHVDSLKRMRAQTDQMAGKIDLAAWPESTLGGYSTEVSSLDQIKRSLRIAHPPFVDIRPARQLGAWLLAGGKTFAPNAPEDGPYFQSAFLIDPAGTIRARYHKRQLMPIGEYMPYERQFSQLHNWARLTEYIGFGESDAPLRLDRGPAVGVLLCYEDIVGDLSRRTVLEGAQALVCLINDSAFEDAVALEQHRRLATLRAIENRRTLIRCAGTGRSCAISPAGDTLASLPLNRDGHFIVAAPLNEAITLYARLGYLFPYACVLALMALPVLARCKAAPLRAKQPDAINVTDGLSPSHAL